MPEGICIRAMPQKKAPVTVPSCSALRPISVRKVGPSTPVTDRVNWQRMKQAAAMTNSQRRPRRTAGES
jgi:hypothetical protein